MKCFLDFLWINNWICTRADVHCVCCVTLHATTILFWPQFQSGKTPVHVSFMYCINKVCTIIPILLPTTHFYIFFSQKGSITDPIILTGIWYQHNLYTKLILSGNIHISQFHSVCMASLLPAWFSASLLNPTQPYSVKPADSHKFKTAIDFQFWAYIPGCENKSMLSDFPESLTQFFPDLISRYAQSPLLTHSQQSASCCQQHIFIYFFLKKEASQTL